jgi:hypothetical protein
MHSGRLKVFGSLGKYLGERRLYRQDETEQIVADRDSLQDAMRRLLSGISRMSTKPEPPEPWHSSVRFGTLSWMALISRIQPDRPLFGTAVLHLSLLPHNKCSLFAPVLQGGGASRGGITKVQSRHHGGEVVVTGPPCAVGQCVRVFIYTDHLQNRRLTGAHLFCVLDLDSVARPNIRTISGGRSRPLLSV